MRAEFHTVILWHNALEYESLILEHLKKTFVVRYRRRVAWTSKLFGVSLRRFYGPEATLADKKASIAGTGPFLILLVEDINPKYELRQTTDGPRTVNIAIHAFKSTVRSLLPNQWLLHTSVTHEECVKDCALIFHDLPKAVALWARSENTLHQDLLGANGFETLKKAFWLLNVTVPYCLLFRRAYAVRGVLTQDQVLSGDYDILTADHLLVASLLNATPRSNDMRRRNYSIRIRDQDTPIDIRDTFDGYFCPVWSRDILDRFQIFDSVRVPGDDDLFYSSLYHVCVHKGRLDNNYAFLIEEARNRGLKLSNESDVHYHTRKFLIRSTYSAPAPTDPGLPDSTDARTSLVRRSFVPPSRTSGEGSRQNHAVLRDAGADILDAILPQLATARPVHQKRATGWYESRIWKATITTRGIPANVCVKHEEFISTEMREHAFRHLPLILSRLDSDYTPRLYAHKIVGTSFITCSEWIDGKRLHENFSEIVTDLILTDEFEPFIEVVRGYLDFLGRKGIAHRDIWAKNIIVRNRRPVFIDFTWSSLQVDAERAYYPPLAVYRDDAVAIESLIDLLRNAAAEVASASSRV